MAKKKKTVVLPTVNITSAGTVSGRKAINQAFGAQTKVTRSGKIIKKKKLAITGL